MENQENIKSLVKLAQAGDVQSFGQIYDLLIDKVYRFIYFRVNNKEETEDLTEGVFLKIYEKLKTYKDNGAPFEAWVFKIARNNLIDYYRSKKRTVNIEEAHHIEDDRMKPEELADERMNHEIVLKGIKELSDTYREIIVLKFIENKDNKEISEILNKPIDHVRVLQSRALKALRKVLTDKL